MAENDDNIGPYTSPGECIAVGCIGLLGYTLICMFAIWTLYNCKCGSTRYYIVSFLVMMLLSGVLSFPWWIVNIVDPAGLGLWEYSMFVVSRLIFIQAFCIISLMWATFLGREFQKWNSRLLMVLNAILILLTGTGLGIQSHQRHATLTNLYSSSSYRIFIIIEACIYLLLSGFLSFIGIRLLTQISTWSSLSDLGIKTQTFKRALANLRIILAVVVCSFLLQATMLLVESVLVRSTYDLSRRGVLWSLLHDIIPRVVPAVTLMVFMKKNDAGVDMGRAAAGGHVRSVVLEEAPEQEQSQRDVRREATDDPFPSPMPSPRILSLDRAGKLEQPMTMTMAFLSNVNANETESPIHARHTSSQSVPVYNHDDPDRIEDGSLIDSREVSPEPSPTSPSRNRHMNGYGTTGNALPPSPLTHSASSLNGRETSPL